MTQRDSQVSKKKIRLQETSLNRPMEQQKIIANTRDANLQ